MSLSRRRLPPAVRGAGSGVELRRETLLSVPINDRWYYMTRTAGGAGGTSGLYGVAYRSRSARRAPQMASIGRLGSSALAGRGFCAPDPQPFSRQRPRLRVPDRLHARHKLRSRYPAVYGGCLHPIATDPRSCPGGRIALPPVMPTHRAWTAQVCRPMHRRAPPRPAAEAVPPCTPSLAR